MRRHHLDALFQVYLGSKFCPSVLEIASLRVTARYIRDFAPQVNIVPLLDALQLLMLFAGTLTYSEPKMFSLIIFYNGPGIILKH
jgi:hypothetical protein